MSPRRGGAADKLGNRYEGRWTVRQVLRILHGDADAIEVEPVGEIGDGIEFILQHGAITEAHQVKRQLGVANEWDLPNLNAKGVLKAARRHVAAGRQFHLTSVIPARVLDELADRARQTPDLQTFVDHMVTSEELRKGWSYLSVTAYGSEETAWDTLRGIYVRSVDEASLRSEVSAWAGLLLEGAEPLLAAAGLAELIADNPSTRLDAPKIGELLQDYGLRRRPIVATQAASQSVQQLAARWQAGVGRELLQPPIPRSEADQIGAHLLSEAGRPQFVIGPAGSGKSAVLNQAVDQIVTQGWPVLAVRLDRVEPFSSPEELGVRCGLDVSPASALAAVAGGGPSMLVIDQLDAVSLASGRMPNAFDAIADLIREAAAFPEMRIVLACRKYDVENDHRIRALTAAEGVVAVEVAPLSDEQVDAAVEAMGLSAADLTASQRELLRSPLHLVLLRTIADQFDALSFGSDRQLFDAYWDRKRREGEGRRPQLRFATTIGVLAEAMSEQQRLTAPRSVLDRDDLQADADILISSNVLVQDGRQLAFFHEAFFDYAFARQWVSRDQTLVAFLQASEQELFRRAQVRQILFHLRDEDPGRCLVEVEAVLREPTIRFHIKETVLTFLGSLSNPATAEWEMITRLAAADLPFANRIWIAIRTRPWFDCLDGAGVIERWLAEDDEANQNRAVGMMLAAVNERPDRLAELLAPDAGRKPQYSAWLGAVTQVGELHRSRALFDLVLASVRRGDYIGRERALWLAAHGLSQHRPDWSVELLAAYLQDQPGALDLDSLGYVKRLETADSGAIELTARSTTGAPERFCELLLPYLRQVMAITEDDPGKQPLTDRHFSHRSPIGGPLHRFDDALLHGTAGALRQLVSNNPTAAQPFLDTLAADPHDSAQWLLYESLLAAGERYATWAADLLLQGSPRLVSGYTGNPAWTARLLLQAITPHLLAETIAALEQAILDARPPGHDARFAAWVSFTLLSGMPEDRLSAAARRRLGELRRQFNVDQPREPVGIHGGFVRSPIPPEAADKMNDEQWLGAMAKYSGDSSSIDAMAGGAYELSQVLKTETLAEPTRFARLALRLTADMNPAYGSAVLQAFADTKEPIEPALVFDVVRHIASLGNEDYQDWLGWPLRRYRDDLIPDDIIEIIIDRALHATSPTEEGWARDDDRGPLYGGDIWNNGLNTARGQSAVVLGDLLARDTDGHRTALVAPVLGQLAEDPSVAVRSCVAHLMAFCLRYARDEVVAAFPQLIQTDDRLLATTPVLELMTYIGVNEPAVIEPVAQRMMASADNGVRKAGGMMAVFAGLELGLNRLLTAARESQDTATRQGAAEICAQRLPYTADSAAATTALEEFFNDQDDDVRQAAAQVAGALRERALRPTAGLLTALISSEAFQHALPQLLITLDEAPDGIYDLVILCARRFLDIYAADVENIATAAAGEARDVGRLIIRAYAQAPDVASRAQTLDLIDELLLAGAFDFARMVSEAER
jgi:hypothetical protein